MIWIIQQWIKRPGVGETASEGLWEHVRDSHGVPLMFSYKVDVEREMSRLKCNNRQVKFRLQHIKD